MKLFFKYGMIYREVLTTPKMEICSLYRVRQTDKNLLNRWAATVTDIIEDTEPGLIHECPYSVS